MEIFYTAWKCYESLINIKNYFFFLSFIHLMLQIVGFCSLVYDVRKHEANWMKAFCTVLPCKENCNFLFHSSSIPSHYSLPF